MMMDSARLRRPRRDRLVDSVVRSLDEAILSGRMRPGERLLTTQLAENLEVSQATVREALLMLQSRGLVSIRPRRGTFVTRLSPEEARDLCRVRAIMESYALEIGFARIDAAFKDNLLQLVAELETCQLPDDMPRIIELDLAIHQLIVEIGESPRLIEVWSSLNGRIGALFLTGLEYQNASLRDVVSLHQALIEAITSRDLERARKAVIDHYLTGDPERHVHGAAMIAAAELVTVDDRESRANASTFDEHNR
jgi:DNA-binding GntR family transcriptional regulator